MQTVTPYLELEVPTGETSALDSEEVVNAAALLKISETKDSDHVRLLAAALLLDRLSNLELKAKNLEELKEVIAEFFGWCVTYNELLEPSGWEQRENFAYKPLLRVSSLQLGAFQWEPEKKEGWHLHHDCRGGCAFAFIKVVSGVCTHEVGDVIGADPNTGKILITPSRQEVLRTGDIAIVTPRQAHLLANKSTETLFTAHMYITPVKKPIDAKCLHIVREKSA
ncbi:MAG TPA: hypothetical protein V6D21_22075 [Candidatus Obscuribacterales bacterium]